MDRTPVVASEVNGQFYFMVLCKLLIYFTIKKSEKYVFFTKIHNRFKDYYLWDCNICSIKNLKPFLKNEFFVCLPIHIFVYFINFPVLCNFYVAIVVQQGDADIRPIPATPKKISAFAQMWF